MIKHLILWTALLILSPLSYGYQAGVTLLQYQDKTRNRMLDTRIFYPTEADGPAELQGDNQVFVGVPAIRDAAMARGSFPLIVISHGSGGNNTSQAWLATVLAQRGAIVVAANHPGSTTGDSLPAQSILLWLQVEDIPFIISSVLNDSRWSNAVDKRRIGAIGHSKGGYSVIAVAGGRASLDSFIRYCETQPEMPDCQFFTRANVDFRSLPYTKFDGDYRDPRISFAIALDAGMSFSMQSDSLRTLTTPLLIIPAQYYHSRQKEINLGAATLISQLPAGNRHLVEPQQASHFDFIPTCKPNAVEILADDDGETFICAESAAKRKAIQNESTEAILTFLQRLNVLP